MKRLCVLLSLVMVLGLISGCSSTKTSETTATQTPTTQVIPQNYEVFTKTTLNKTSLTVGEELTIQTEIQYVGDESPLSGVPVIVIWDSDMSTVASWYLDQDGKLLSGYPSVYYKIEKEKKYVMDITWDLINNYSNMSVPSGKYSVQITIYKHNPDEERFLMTNEMGFAITITNDNPEQTPSPTTFPQGYQVFAKTTLNKTSLTVGEELSIQSEIQYGGDESTISGVPIIMIIDASHNVAAFWYLDPQGITLLQTGPMEYYQIEKNKKYVINAT